MDFAKTCDGKLNIFGFDRALCIDQVIGFFCNLLSSLIFAGALVKVIRTEQSSELSVAMIGLFIFASASSCVRFATLSVNIKPGEHFFGQTTVTTDYLFAGAMTTARWLFSFKIWQVSYEMPKLFLLDHTLKRHNKLYTWINGVIIACINIPWVILACCNKSADNFVDMLVITTWTEYSVKLLIITMLIDCFRRFYCIERTLPMLKVKKRGLCLFGGLILLWIAQWSVMLGQAIFFTKAHLSVQNSEFQNY
jgi:hypothetical protein